MSDETSSVDNGVNVKALLEAKAALTGMTLLVATCRFAATTSFRSIPAKPPYWARNPMRRYLKSPKRSIPWTCFGNPMPHQPSPKRP